MGPEPGQGAPRWRAILRFGERGVGLCERDGGELDAQRCGARGVHEARIAETMHPFPAWVQALCKV